MIRLSRQTAFEVSNDTFARDLDVSPFLHIYRQDTDNPSDVILIQGDSSPNRPSRRNNAFAPFWNNVLLGTENFYPEKGLNRTNYHNESTVQNLLGDSILPTINYKKATLYFSQGSLSDSSILGYTLRLYCLDKRGFKINLLSMVDFKSDSNVVAKTPKYFETQIFNEGIDVEFIDVEYLINSNDSDVQAIKELLFGSYRPDRIYIEYAPINFESVDNFEENGFVFTSVNTTAVNEQSLPISFVGSGEDLYNEVGLTNNDRSIRSQLKHRRFNVADFLETQKESEQRFEIKHIFSINAYDGNNNLIESFAHSIQNVGNIYGDVVYRPVLDVQADHAKIDCSVKIENVQTGLIYTVNSSMTLTPSTVTGFKTTPVVVLDGIQVNKVSNTVNRVVNEIIQKNETPNIITLEKKVYIHSQQAGILALYDGDFTAKIELPDGLDVTGNVYHQLKIGTLTINSSPDDPLMFHIPKEAFRNDHGNTYTLLDGNGQVITSGALVKKTYQNDLPTLSQDTAIKVDPKNTFQASPNPKNSFQASPNPKNTLQDSVDKYNTKTAKSSKLSFDFAKAKK